MYVYIYIYEYPGVGSIFHRVNAIFVEHAILRISCAELQKYTGYSLKLGR